MRTRWQTFRSVVVWCLATLAGIAVCWWGVRPVLDAAVPDRLVAFPAAEPPPVVAAAPSRVGSPSASPSGRPSRLPRSFSSTGTASASPTATVVDGWTRFPDGRFTQTFQLVGGTATLSARDGVVELLSATPNPGYVMTVSPTGDDRVLVNFTGLSLHMSTLDARWSGSAPSAEVTELP